MDQSLSFRPDRRQFLSGVMPVCALSFLGCASAREKKPVGDVQQEQEAKPMQEAKHKFDQEFDQPLTWDVFFKIRYGEFMQLAAALEKEWGRDKLIDFLEKQTTERMLRYGQSQAKQMGKDDFQSYVGLFRGDQYANTLTKEIVEDTPRVFEIKVTECIWAKTFLDAKLGHVGHAHVCWGDYAWAQGFNPRIRMVRDKTLMQGHGCCNHRYLWEG